VSVLDVKWSKRGDKFSACTGSKLVSTGYFAEETNWWTCVSMKDHKSSVICARFDHSGLFLVSGSTDLKVYISSAYLPDLDDKYSDEYTNIPFTKSKFGETLMSFNLSAWVNAVAWSPSSNFCFLSTHDSVLTVVDNLKQTKVTVNLSHSPITSIVPVSDKLIYAVAYDRHIYEYELTNGEWLIKRTITKDGGTPSGATTESSGNVGVAAMLSKFQGGTQKKQSVLVTSTVQKNIHSSTVNSMSLFNNNIIVTSDYTGFVKMWNI